MIPLFIWSPEEEGEWSPGDASRCWLDRSLRALAASLEARGSRLIVRRGPTLQALLEVAQHCGSNRVVWNRRIEPAIQVRDAMVEGALREQGLAVHPFNGSLLLEPQQNLKKDGTPYRVFTPFWNAMKKRIERFEETPAPAQLRAPVTWPRSLSIDSLQLDPRGGAVTDRVQIQSALAADSWVPGEDGACRLLASFLSEDLRGYPTERERPSATGTSRLSPHLRFGEISPHTIWNAASDCIAEDEGSGVAEAGEAWLRQLAWREFSHHLLHHFPETTDQPLRADFSRFAWREDEHELRAWQQGLTGYPLVDAGMRELLGTGWMHNRVRMVVASFLVKDLRQPWQHGARWFWERLVDADLANNTMGWQWCAGCGADAAPYFRVFNPLLQSRRYDPDGTYLRRWIPELSRLDNRWIHEPHRAPTEVLEAAGVTIGSTYPAPLVEHDQAKRLALDAYQALTSKR